MRKNFLFLCGALTGTCLTLLVTGPQSAHLVAAAKAAANAADTYSQLNLFGEVFERVRTDYVEKPDDTKLIEGAINGMVTSLDPHSRYMNDKAWRDMQETTQGEFGGLGIEVTMEDGLVKVVSPIDDTPAAKAGILSGDLITQIDGDAVQGLYARAGRQQDEGAGRYQDQAQDRPQGRRRADRRHDHARDHPRAPGALPHRRRRYRLYPDHLVQRADHRRPAQGDRRHREGDSAGEAGRLRRRPAQQSGRTARPGGLGVEHLHGARRGGLDAGPHPRGNPALHRAWRRSHQGQAAGRSDQRRLGLGFRDRRRRAARSQARHPDRHALVRQGLGADHHPARHRQRRAGAHHGALLHAVRAIRSRRRASRPTSRCCRMCPTS